MKGYFTKPGPYKNGTGKLVITEGEVKAKKVFDVNDDNAKYFVSAGAFVAGDVPKAADPKDFDGEKPKEKKKVPAKESGDK